jgi:hypothetical protein
MTWSFPHDHSVQQAFRPSIIAMSISPVPAMPTAEQTAVRIATPKTTKHLSTARKKFNTLVKQVDAERIRLATWRDEAPKMRALAASELLPLSDVFGARYRDYLLLLDAAWSNKAINKTERAKLSDLISHVASDLMDRFDDAQIKAIYDKHSALAFDLDADAEMMREMVSAATGIELDDDADLSSPSALLAAMQKKMEENEAAEEARQAGKAKAKPTARELRQQAEEAKLKQSVRDIFRKLASALHPDRATDPADHARKTALMQRANVAYTANDLLGLLELQLEVEQIDQTGLDNLGDDRIKSYNRILQGQVDEIRIDIMAFETALAFDIGIMPGDHKFPNMMLRDLRAEIEDMRTDVTEVEADLKRFADIKKLKAWLREYEIGDVDDEPWF